MDLSCTLGVGLSLSARRGRRRRGAHLLPLAQVPLKRCRWPCALSSYLPEHVAPPHAAS